MHKRNTRWRTHPPSTHTLAVIVAVLLYLLEVVLGPDADTVAATTVLALGWGLTHSSRVRLPREHRLPADAVDDATGDDTSPVPIAPFVNARRHWRRLINLPSGEDRLATLSCYTA